jgi:hypothetical protein
MKRCYKCQKPYVEPNGPGFQDACEGCESYLHCCQNCYFYDPEQHNSCTEPVAEFVSDANGMNRCEYFRFKASSGRSAADDDGGRRFKKADWRNLEKKEGAPRGGGRGGGRMKSPFGDRPKSRGEKAQKAREALENLFKKD